MLLLNAVLHTRLLINCENVGRATEDEASIAILNDGSLVLAIEKSFIGSASIPFWNLVAPLLLVSIRFCVDCSSSDSEV